MEKQHLDNEYHKRFSNRELPASADETEALWDSIESELGQAPSGNKYKIIAGITLFALLALVWWWTIDHAAPEASAPENIQPQQEDHFARSNTTVTQAHELTVSEPYQSSKQDTHNNESDHPTVLAKPQPQSTHQRPIAQGTTFTVATAGNQIDKSDTDPTENQSQPANEANIVSNTNVSLFASNHEDETPDDIEFPQLSPANRMENTIVLPSNWAPIAPLELPFRALLKDDGDLPALPTQASKASAIKQASNWQWQLAFSSGFNTSQLQFGGNAPAGLAALRNRSTSAFIGTSYAAGLTAIRNNTWLLGTGLEWHKQWEKFDYRQEQDTQILKSNQLLQVWLNRSNGDTLKAIYGDTLVHGLITREVVHYNQYEHLSIPLLLGWQKQVKNWRLATMAGPVLNVALRQTGKMLNDSSTIVSISQGPFAKIQAGISAGATLSYQLTGRWAIGLRPQWDWILPARNPGSDLNLQAHRWRMMATLVYTPKGR